ncbi:MAG: hypothetical protein F4206_00590 [Gammaproteobacteria bacterium]|nr:hypothetical protein [Gammaproteobacteria bacterium]MYG65211.1 hypothetical protein [Gammaproteobacteria bacterium]
MPFTKMPDPDLTIYNATSLHAVVFAHSEAGRNLLAEHYGLSAEVADWVCIEPTGTAAARRFRALHGRIVDARLRVRHEQASRARLDELTGGHYSAFSAASNPRVA